jgi:hypothetical protein
MFGSSGIWPGNYPDPARSARDGPQLALLVGDGQRVAEDRRREAALRADAEALEVDDRRASRTRASSSSSLSGRGPFVVTRPRITCLSSGTSASGSKPPERSSSYSSRRRCAWTPPKIGPAIAS